jgi:hypothetical protein
LSHRRTTDSCGARGTLGSTGESWRTAVDGVAAGGRQWHGEVGHPASLAGALSCKWTLADEKATVVQTLGTNVDGER